MQQLGQPITIQQKKKEFTCKSLKEKSKSPTKSLSLETFSHQEPQ